ncbi:MULTISPECIES: MFS transporter [unclassified Vibrio]|uniref:MFS transporter n=1 Tax=Vibrio sp. HB236076 TaxID=3232307 RepID=A0AB39HDD0_9VIBR|nr:MFS transporter [Vibrio sp. HB161653]MDP5253817.1 MFS transporter [Vibrio sp. HB161653]
MSRSFLCQQHFLPYFTTQFLGAFNDNVFKNVLLLFVAFAPIDTLPIDADVFINLAAGLFILPFFLFSATAGTLADQWDKSHYIRLIKLLEVLIMACGAVGFLTHDYRILLFLLFLMGTQSAFFGPVKYSILPQHLAENQLTRANAWVEMGTFIAILTGTIVAGVIASNHSAYIIAATTVFLCALMGYVCSYFIPPAPSVGKLRPFRWQPIRDTKRTLKDLHASKSLLTPALSISWFWFLGATYLTQFPNYTQEYLHAPQGAVSFLLALFSIGIATGSMLCARICQQAIEPALAPLGMLLMGLSGMYFSLQSESISQVLPVFTQTLTFMFTAKLWGLFTAIFVMGVSGGLFIVPLYTQLQTRAKADRRSQVIAALNIYNALFMVASAIVGMLFLGLFNGTITALFTLLAAGNLLLAIALCYREPITVLRYLVQLLLKLCYRIRIQHLDRLPKQGSALIIANHVSYLDALLITTLTPRRIRFVMQQEYTTFAPIRRVLKNAGVIPISAQKKGSVRQAMAEIEQALNKGELVCLFPEGRLTPDGHLQPFMRGLDSILSRSQPPVLPIAINGLWGSYFSRYRGRACRGVPKPTRPRIEMTLCEMQSATETHRHQLHHLLLQHLAAPETPSKARSNQGDSL